MDLAQAFGTGMGSSDRVDRLIALVERMDKIDRVIDRIKYNDELLLEMPETIKFLGDARQAVIAELKIA